MIKRKNRHPVFFSFFFASMIVKEDFDYFNDLILEWKKELYNKNWVLQNVCSSTTR